MADAIQYNPDKPQLTVGERVQIFGKWYRILSLESQRIGLRPIIDMDAPRAVTTLSENAKDASR